MPRTALTTLRTPASARTADSAGAILLRAVLLGAAFLALSIAPARADFATVTGVVVFPEDETVPPDTALAVRVLDIGRGLDNASVLAEQRLATTSTPAPFRLVYDRRLIRTTGTYQLRAEISRSGRRLFLGSADLPRSGTAQAAPIEIRLANPTRSAGAIPLFDREYRAVELRGEALPGHIGVTVEFLREGTVRGSTGCNRLNGPYTLTAETLDFGRLAVTRRACTNDRNRIEKRTLRVMRETRGWRLRGAELQLIDERGKAIATLRDDL